MKLLSVFGIGLLRILQATFNKQASRCMDSTQRYLRFGCYFEAAAALFSFLYLCIVGFYGFGTATVVCAAVTGTCFVSELLTALTAMRGAPLVLCNLFSLGGGIVLPSVVGIFFFGEPMSLLQWLGVALFFTAVCFLSPVEKTAARKLDVKTTGILLLNFLINGLCSLSGKYFAVRVDDGNVALYSCLSYGFAAVLFGILNVCMLLKKRDDRSETAAPFPKKLYPYGLILGAVCATIVFCSTNLSRIVPIVILNTVPSTVSIIGCLLLGGLLFEEKITMKNVVGVILGVLSAVLIVSF